MPSSSITDWILAITSIIAAIAGISGMMFALVQIKQIRMQLRDSSLANMISLESEIRMRRTRIDDFNREIEKLNANGKLDAATKAIEMRYYESAVEEWLNSVDRLCYCIQKGYFRERDWQSEYRDYIRNIVRTFPEKFAAGSIYTNTKDLNEKWMRS